MKTDDTREIHNESTSAVAPPVQQSKAAEPVPNADTVAQPAADAVIKDAAVSSNLTSIQVMQVVSFWSILVCFISGSY